MNAILKSVLAVAGLAIATQAVAQITFYEREGFAGRSFSTNRPINNLERYGFNDRASSVIVIGDRREVCEDARFDGRCVVLRPGRYPTLAAMGLNDRITSVRVVSRNTRVDDERYAPAPSVNKVTFYESENFAGRSFTTEQPVGNFGSYGFNDSASSVVVVGERWEVCEDARFAGDCFVLHPGRYPSLEAMGLNNRISSARVVDANTRLEDNRYAPAPAAAYDYHRRSNERMYEAQVTSVRAVVATPEQRCWVESEQIPQEKGNANVPGALVGAVIGGILGHQVGGGRGKDLATVGGAVAGGLVGANVGRDGGQPATTRDVKRCSSVPSQAKADYWDVTYTFRGQEHRVQMATPPGNTVTVNEQGEPRA